MIEIIQIHRCDYPDCDETENVSGYNIWGYTPGKGRKPGVVAIDLCAKHLDEIKTLVAHFFKVGNPDAAIYPEDRSK